MKSTLLMSASVLVWLLATGLPAADDVVPPQLRKKGEATQLIVAGKPFVMLAGDPNSVRSSTRDPSAIRRERHADDGGIPIYDALSMSDEHGEFLERFGVPHSHRPVPRPGQDPSAVRRERRAGDWLFVSTQNSEDRTSFAVPDPYQPLH